MCVDEYEVNGLYTSKGGLQFESEEEKVFRFKSCNILAVNYLLKK